MVTSGVELDVPPFDVPPFDVPAFEIPDFELGRRLAAAVPGARPVLVAVDDLIDAIRWGGSAVVRFALLAVALAVVVLSIRVAQGVPPADVGESSGEAPAIGASAGTGDVVLSFAGNR